MDETKKIGKTVLSVMIIMTAGKLMGLFREILIGGRYGTGTVESEAWGYAIQFPNIFMDIFFASAFTASFIPVFSGFLEKKGRGPAFSMANSFAGLTLALIGLITAVLIIFAPIIIRLNLFFAGGELEACEIYALAVPLLRILLPLIFLTGGAFLVTGILQAMEEFRAPAAMSLASNLIIVLYLLFFIERFGIYGLALVFSLGMLGQILIQFPALRKKGFPFRPRLDFKDREIRQGLKDIGRLMLPVMVSSWAIPINVYVNTIIAGRVTGVAAVRFAYTIFAVITGILVLSASNVLFTRFSKLQNSNQTEDLTQVITDSSRGILFFLLPLSAILFVLAPAAISIIYERGAFTPESTLLTGGALRFFALGMAGFGLYNILSRGFFACRDGKTPLIASLTAIGLNVFLSHILVNPMGTGGPALAFSLSITAASLILFISLVKKGMLSPDRLFFADLAKMLFLALTAGFIAAIAFDGAILFFGRGRFPMAGAGAIAAILGGSWYLLGAWFLNIKEAAMLTRTKSQHTNSPLPEGESASPRILMVSNRLGIGGAETNILELCRALAAKGFSIRAASAGGVYANELVSCGIPHHKLPLSNKNPISLFIAYRALRKIIIEHQITIIHVHARIPAFICDYLHKRLKVRFVTTAHLDFKTNFPYNLLSNWGQAALAVSEDLKDYLVKNYNYEPSRIIVTINGIDTEKFSPETDPGLVIEEFGLDTGKKRIVCLSRLDSDRSLPALCLAKAAPALEKARPGELEILIVGSGDDFTRVKKAVQWANETVGRKMIILTGGRQDVNRFLATADIFVNVSRSALEAMAAAKPVILAGNQGYMGILTPDNLEAAILSNFCCRGGYPDTSEALLTKDILTLLDMSGEKLAELGAFGREIIKTRYSVDRMAEDAMAIYDLVSRPLKRYDAVLCGYYGTENSGDNFILSSITGAISRHVPGARIAVLCRRPRETAKLYGVKTIYIFNPFAIYRLLGQTNLLISGGGTLIADNTSTRSLIYYLLILAMAMRRGCKTMIYSSGIGPFKSGKNRLRAAKILRKVDLITLRDDLALKELARMTTPGAPPIQAVVTADPGFGFVPQVISSAPLLKALNLEGKPFYCVSMRAWKTLPEDFAEICGGFVDHMYEKHGLSALFILMQPAVDLDISRRIIAAAKTGGASCVLITRYLPFDEIFSLMKESRFVAAMRLHAIAYAAKVGAPIIGLSYDPKVQGMFDIFSQSHCVPVEEVTTKTLISFAENVLENRLEISAQLTSVCEELAQKAEFSAISAAEIIKRREVT